MQRLALALPALAALVISLAALVTFAPAARAQVLTLNSGDTLTVSGGGTVGRYGTATYLPGQNRVATYSDAGGGIWAVQTNGGAAFSLGAGATLADTQTGFGLYAHGSGAVTVTGGTISAGDGGHGLYGNALYYDGSGPVTISGGTISGDGDGMVTQGSGPVTISGGAFTGGQGNFGLLTNGSGTVTITGGTFTAGAGGAGLYAAISTMDLYGIFPGLGIGQARTLPDSSGSFFGTLQNNTVGQTFTYINDGTITLHGAALSAPEPSQDAALAAGALGVAGLGIRARRRHAQD